MKIKYHDILVNKNPKVNQTLIIKQLFTNFVVFIGNRSNLACLLKKKHLKDFYKIGNLDD